MLLSVLNCSMLSAQNLRPKDLMQNAKRKGITSTVSDLFQLAPEQTKEKIQFGKTLKRL